MKHKHKLCYTAAQPKSKSSHKEHAKEMRDYHLRVFASKSCCHWKHQTLCTLQARLPGVLRHRGDRLAGSALVGDILWSDVPPYPESWLREPQHRDTAERWRKDRNTTAFPGSQASKPAEPVHTSGKLSIHMLQERFLIQITAIHCWWRWGKVGAFLSWLWCPHLRPANAPFIPSSPRAWCFT